MSSKKLAALLPFLIVSTIAVASGGNQKAKLGEAHGLSLPAQAVLDEAAEPLVARDGKVGFVASVTGGSLISFNVSTGKVLNSIYIGETLGVLSMSETGGRRLVAVPAGNRPTAGSPATITVIDATNGKAMEPRALLVLPADASVTPATRALLSPDGRFCFVASTFDQPSLLSFNVETGHLVSRLALGGRPSDFAIHDSNGRRAIAVASPGANSLFLVDADETGALSVRGSFSPNGAALDDSNNPEFSADGTAVYLAARTGNRLFVVDAETAREVATVSVAAPFRVTVARHGGKDYVAVTHGEKIGGATGRGGVAIFSKDGNAISSVSNFSPPEGIEFSRSNNAAFTSDGATVFVSSSSGVLFAFGAETGQLESYNVVGRELRRITLSEAARAVAAVKSSSDGDQVVLVRFDLESEGPGDPAAPIIDSLTPSVVEQGRLKNLRFRVTGRNFLEGSLLVVNGIDINARLVRGGAALETRLAKSLFDQVGAISVRVRAPGGALSEAKDLIVTRPDTPIIDQIEPAEVPGPAEPFMLQVAGSNFRKSMTIFAGDQPLHTERLSERKLRATIPATIAGKVGALKISVRDVAVPDLVSPEDRQLVIFGPRISALSPSVDTVVAGDGRFSLKIVGENFRPGAQVDLSLNGGTLITKQAQVRSKKVIRLRVVPSAFQDAGSMKVVVRNPDGAGSDPAELIVHGPEISSVLPGQIVAGLTDVRVVLLGDNFRRRARVYVGNESGAFRIDRHRVSFRSRHRIVVRLTGDLNALTAAAGEIRFSVVNTNSGDGVASPDASVGVVGPKITDAAASASEQQGFDKVVIQGENFRRGALVEFLVDDMVMRRQAPLRVRSTKLVLLVRHRKLEGMRSYQVRVVNPGNVPSEPFSPHPDGGA